MKNCIALNVLLLLFTSQLIAGNPVLKTFGKPVESTNLMYGKELVLDVTLPVVDGDSLSSIISGEALSDKRYNFPDLDDQLTNAVEEMVATITEDNMSDLTDIPENEEEKKGKEAIVAAKANGTKIDNFDDLTNMVLPAYRIQKIGNIEAIIVINSLRIEALPSSDGTLPAGGRLGIYIGIKIPQKNYDSQGNKKNVTLIFGTEDLAFTKEGGIKTGNIRLVNDVYFELGGAKRRSIVRLSQGDMASGTGTYIKFGCNGVEEFSIGGGLYFTREWMLPADESGTPSTDGTDRVMVGIDVKVQDWNNMMITVSTDQRFVLTKFQKMSFYLSKCSIDLSDYENPAGMTFPKEYEFSQDIFPEADFPDANSTQFPEDVPANLKNLWRGVYIETFELTFPKPFKRKCDGNYGNNSDNGSTSSDNPSCRMKVAAEKLLIDRTGVSGKFLISSQSPLVSGALMDDKWSWSLDEVGVAIVQNKLDVFYFKGGIVLPITKKTTPCKYNARIDFNNNGPDQTQGHDYYFGITIQDDIEFPVFDAFNVNLESTTLEVSVVDEKFKPRAVLNGYMTIGKGATAAAGEKVVIPKITFENLTLETHPTYITNGDVFLSGGGNKLNGFPIQISGIGLGWGDDKVHLDFNLGVHLMSQTDGGLSATGLFKIHGKVVDNAIGAQEWQYENLEMSGFEFEIKITDVFEASGKLEFFDGNNDYGKGFMASMDAKVMKKEDGGSGSTSSFELEMVAIFGMHGGMRYFMVDGFASGAAINVPLAPTPLALTGFGGGVQYRMKVDSYIDPNSIPEGSELPIGADVSGLVYKPDPATLFGIKFSTSIGLIEGTSEGATLDGMLSCIIRFGPGLELQNIMFWGTAELIKASGAPTVDISDGMNGRVEGFTESETEMHKKDMDETKAAEDKIAAKLGISMDFDGGYSLHGFAEVKIAAAQGKLTGFGQLDLLINPNGTTANPDGEWHLYVGGYENGEIVVPGLLNPANSVTLYPIDIVLTYDDINITASSYFLTGNKIPGPPPLNAAAADFFDLEPDANEDNRDIIDNDGSGSGPSLANGSGVAFGASMFMTCDYKFKRKFFGKKVTIVELKASGGAGFDISLLQYDENTYCQSNPGEEHGLNSFRATGNIWAYINVSGKVLGFGIGNIGLGVILQADVPNPNFFRAKAVLKFKGTWEFEFELGDECGGVITP